MCEWNRGVPGGPSCRVHMPSLMGSAQTLYPSLSPGPGSLSRVTPLRLSLLYILTPSPHGAPDWEDLGTLSPDECLCPTPDEAPTERTRISSVSFTPGSTCPEASSHSGVPRPIKGVWVDFFGVLSRKCRNQEGGQAPVQGLNSQSLGSKLSPFPTPGIPQRLHQGPESAPPPLPSPLCVLPHHPICSMSWGNP